MAQGYNVVIMCDQYSDDESYETYVLRHTSSGEIADELYSNLGQAFPMGWFDVFEGNSDDFEYHPRRAWYMKTMRERLK